MQFMEKTFLKVKKRVVVWVQTGRQWVACLSSRPRSCPGAGATAPGQHLQRGSHHRALPWEKIRIQNSKHSIKSKNCESNHCKSGAVPRDVIVNKLHFPDFEKELMLDSFRKSRPLVVQRNSEPARTSAAMLKALP